MKKLFNSQWRQLYDDIEQKKGGNATLKIQSILGKLGLVSFIIMIFLSLTYEQGSINKQDPVNEVDKVPVITKNKFAEKYSDVENVIWKVEDGYYKASFTKDGKSLMAYVNYDHQLIGEGYYVEYTDLPEKARERIAERYPEYTPVKQMFFMDNLNNDSDFLNFSGSDLSEEGYFLLIKEGTKEIVLHITKEGDVAHYRSVQGK